MQLRRASAVCVATGLGLFLVEPAAASTDPGDFVPVGDAITGEHDPDWAGWSVALARDGDRVAIGEPFATVGSVTQGGRVRVFDWDGSTWSPAGAELTSSTPLDEFGTDVVLSADGTRLAVTAPNCSPVDKAGYVRVFDWDGSSWAAAGDDIVAPVGSDDCFAAAVAMSDDGDRLVVGSPVFDRVNAYEWDGTSWVAGPPLLGPEGAGASLDSSASGERIVVGARSWWDEVGSVGVYERDGAGWTQVGDSFTVAEDGRIGWAVAISDDGSRIAYSAPIAGPGFVRVLDRVGSAWVQVGADLLGTDDVAFGDSIALAGDGNRIVIADESVVSVHDWNGSAWVRRAAIDTGTPNVFQPPQVAVSGTGARFALDRPRLVVYEGPTAAPPATTTTIATTIATTVPPPSSIGGTLPPTGTGSVSGAVGVLAASLLLAGASAVAVARRATVRP